jgi:hypothetical protein
METLQIALQFLSLFALGFTIGRTLLWLKETKVVKFIIALFILPFFAWSVYKLDKIDPDFWANLQDRIERKKITYYFPKPDENY